MELNKVGVFKDDELPNGGSKGCQPLPSVSMGISTKYAAPTMATLGWVIKHFDGGNIATRE